MPKDSNASGLLPLRTACVSFRCWPALGSGYCPSPQAPPFGHLTLFPVFPFHLLSSRLQDTCTKARKKCVNQFPHICRRCAKNGFDCQYTRKRTPGRVPRFNHQGSSSSAAEPPIKALPLPSTFEDVYGPTKAEPQTGCDWHPRHATEAGAKWSAHHPHSIPPIVDISAAGQLDSDPYSQSESASEEPDDYTTRSSTDEETETRTSIESPNLTQRLLGAVSPPLPHLHSPISPMEQHIADYGPIIPVQPQPQPYFYPALATLPPLFPTAYPPFVPPDPLSEISEIFQTAVALRTGNSPAFNTLRIGLYLRLDAWRKIYDTAGYPKTLHTDAALALYHSSMSVLLRPLVYAAPALSPAVESEEGPPQQKGQTVENPPPADPPAEVLLYYRGPKSTYTPVKRADFSFFASFSRNQSRLRLRHRLQTKRRQRWTCSGISLEIPNWFCIFHRSSYR